MSTDQGRDDHNYNIRDENETEDLNVEVLVDDDKYYLRSILNH